MNARRWRQLDRGVGSSLTGVVTIGIVLAALVSVWLVGWISCIHQARMAADLGAVAGAEQEHRSGLASALDQRLAPDEPLAGAAATSDQACRAAEVTVRQNGATLRDCQVTRGYGQFIVTVEVEVALDPRLAMGPRAVKESSKAGVVVQ